MQGSHHGLELHDLLAVRARRGEAGVRREVADGVVAPVVGEAAGRERALGHRVVHGQELDGGDAEVAKVVDHGGRGEARVGALERRGQVGMARGEPLHVGLVDHRPMPGHGRRVVTLPVERSVHHHASRREGGAVAPVPLESASTVPGSVPAEGVVPDDAPGDRPGVRIEEELGGVEAMALMGGVGPVGAEGVEVAGPDVGDMAVPDVVGALGQREPAALPIRIGAGRRGRAPRRWRARSTPRS